MLKGKLGEFLLSAQSFYRPQTKRSFNMQFSQKSPEVGQKSVQRVQNSRNKNQSAKFRSTATVGIHQFRSTATVGIH